jgi:hypothetical protein
VTHLHKARQGPRSLTPLRAARCADALARRAFGLACIGRAGCIAFWRCYGVALLVRLRAVAFAGGSRVRLRLPRRRCDRGMLAARASSGAGATLRAPGAEARLHRDMRGVSEALTAAMRLDCSSSLRPAAVGLRRRCFGRCCAAPHRVGGVSAFCTTFLC